MPAFSLLRRSPQELKRSKTQCDDQPPQQKKTGSSWLPSSVMRLNPAKSDPDLTRVSQRSGAVNTGSAGGSSGASPRELTAPAPGRKRERGLSTRELFSDLRSRFIGRTPANATPQRGSSTPPSPARQQSPQKADANGRLNPRSTRTNRPQASSKSLPSSHPLKSQSAVPRFTKSSVNPNKPLPSPPPSGSEQTKGTPAKRVLKLERIMASLSGPEIEKLFSGAPQYFARSEGQYTGPPHPSVAYPWDEELAIRDLTDHTQIQDKAWGCCTAWPHIIRDRTGVKRPRRRSSEERQKKYGHFHPRCRERPSMLSMAGREKGSIGYQAALELGVADALQEEQYGFESLSSRCNVIVEKRHKLVTSQDALRHLEESAILEMLMRNGRRYAERAMRERRASSELYNELFSHILYPPTKVLDHVDPYSLSVQIQALIKVLAMPNAWIDFSHVDWRIRLGQLLWDSAADDEVEDDNSTLGVAAAADEIQEERYWLLVQILLSCELLLRLDAIAEGEELGIANIKPAEVLRFEKDANVSVKWSLHLARAWLENIEVAKIEPAALQLPESHPSGWLVSLTKRMSISYETSQQPPVLRNPIYAIKGKHTQRQIEGLTHFARQLRWPDIESCVVRISENCRAMTEKTPISTPLARPASRANSLRSSYSEEKSVRRVPSRRRNVSTVLHPSGWLSKSYISGLVLPGEGTCHFLMSALLENEKEAMSKLGKVANLCGGFVYQGKSFWSTACIVGRVLAAGNGSAECMGWVSSQVLPQGLGDGWVNVEAEPNTEDALQVNKKARIWGKTIIERESGVLGDADLNSVLPADFIMPCESVYRDDAPRNVRVELLTLSLGTSVDSAHTTPTGESLMTATPFSERKAPSHKIHPSPAALTFLIARDADVDDVERECTFRLSTDVYFVTAHPCVPSQRVKIMKSPSSPTVQQVDLTGESAAGKTASVIGHPLHKYYTYTAIHLVDLLAKRDSSLADLLADYTNSKAHRPSIPAIASQGSAAAKVLVIDCVTGFQPQPQEHEMPLSPVASRSSFHSFQSFSSLSSDSATPPTGGRSMLSEAEQQMAQNMHHETRQRQFGSDSEVLVRALCAEKGWNALVSRRRRGCLSCAIREAGALGWKVVVRVE